MNEIKLTMLEKINQILKMAIGSAISWELAILFGSKYPYLGPISLILCIQATLIKSISFGIARIVGTIIGVASVFLVSGVNIKQKKKRNFVQRKRCRKYHSKGSS